MSQGKSTHATQKFSFEFFPPRTAIGEEKLEAVHEKLAALKPDFFSVTYGAGGSTRKGTRTSGLRYQDACSAVAPHLSFGGADEDEVLRLLKDYKAAGVDRIVALRGDLPSGAGSSSNHLYSLFFFSFHFPFPFSLFSFFFSPSHSPSSIFFFFFVSSFSSS